MNQETHWIEEDYNEIVLDSNAEIISVAGGVSIASDESFEYEIHISKLD